MATSDSNIRKKDREQLEMYQGIKEKLEWTWKEKAKVILVMEGTLGAVLCQSNITVESFSPIMSFILYQLYLCIK